MIKSSISAYLLFMLLFPAMSSAQDIAVLPYSVETIQRDFKLEAGEEYSKLISVGATILKGFKVYSFRETQKDIAKLGLDPQGRITRDDIALFCKSRYLSYAVLGRISKTAEGYASKSVLYSAARGGIVADSSARARTIHELASKELLELFAAFNDSHEKASQQGTDIAVVLDTSYSMSRDWNNVYDGLIALSSELINGWPGSKIHLVPFAEKFTLKGTLPEIETVPMMKSSLAAIKLSGGSTGKALSSAIRFAVENTPWRQNSSRMIFVITNSPAGESSFDAYASSAKRKRIAIHTLTLGNLTSRDTEVCRRLSLSTGGKNFSVSYRQKLYDNRGNGYFLYMNAGRLFEGDIPQSSWKDGVLTRHETGSHFVDTPSYADEHALPKDRQITPYTMAEYFKKSGKRSVLNNEALESNLTECISSIAEKSVASGSISSKPIARVLVSHGKTSIWMSVTDQNDLEYLAKQKELGFVFPLGVRVVLKADEPFGMTFNHDSYFTGFDWDGIPQEIRVSLDDMVKNPSKYAKDGLFSPPVYFVNIKVEEIDSRSTTRDIREQRR